MSATTLLVLLAMALFGGFADAFRKVVLGKLGLYSTVGFIYLGFALPFGIAFMIVTRTYPIITSSLIVAHMTALPFVGLTVVLFYSALQKTDFSISASIFGLAPATAMIGEWIIGRSEPSWAGALGILVVSLGAYILHLDAFKHGPLTPFKRLLKDRGARHALYAVIAIAIAIPFQREAVCVSKSPGFWMVVESSLCIPFLLFGVIKERAKWQVTTQTRLFTLGAGSMWSIHGILLYTGLQLTLGGYVMAMRSLALLVGFTLAYLILREKVRSRIPGMLVIIIGTFVISLLA